MLHPPRPHLGRLTRQDLRTIVTCSARVLADSTRTMDIVTVEELTAQKQLRYLLDAGVFAGDGAGLLEDRPSLETLDLNHLRSLPEDTFGRAVARFFDRNGLTLDLYGVEAEYTAEADAKFLMQRIRQSHDLWHVLMGFTVDGHEEILLHAFSLAQTGLPSSIALMALGSLKHMLLEARFGCLLSGMTEAYARGKAAKPLIGVRWENYWELPLDDVRAEFDILPWSDDDRAATKPWRFKGPRRLAA